MVQTVRTFDALVALLADNTDGEISPEDLRDAVVSLWQNTIPNWTDVAFVSGQLVRRPDGRVFEANAAITAGTGFVLGSTGATWRPALAGLGAGRAFSQLAYRRDNTDLTFGTVSDGVFGAGTLVIFDALTAGDRNLQLPASTSDDDLGVYFACLNSSPGHTINLTAEVVGGHTITIQGYAFPFQIPDGVSVELMCVERTASTTVYRLRQWDSGVEGTSRVESTSGATFNVEGRAGRPRLIRHAHTANSAGTFTGVGSLAIDEAQTVRINNNSNNGSLSMGITGNATYDGRITSRVMLEPGRSQDFTVMNLAGNLAVSIESAARHRFASLPNDILTNTGLVMPAPPARIQPILNNTGTPGQMVVQPFFSGLLSVTFEATPNYVGNSNATPSLVSAELFLEGSAAGQGRIAELSVQRDDPSEPRAQLVRTWTHVPVTEGNVLTFDIRGLSDTAGAEMRLIDVLISWDIEV
ncbi:MAG: hypothetical protein ACR2PR_08045 [Pseudohongiellaceae bacterium]